jgi:hypothetical protein
MTAVTPLKPNNSYPSSCSKKKKTRFCFFRPPGKSEEMFVLRIKNKLQAISPKDSLSLAVRENFLSSLDSNKASSSRMLSYCFLGKNGHVHFNTEYKRVFDCAVNAILKSFREHCQFFEVRGGKVEASLLGLMKIFILSEVLEADGFKTPKVFEVEFSRRHLQVAMDSLKGSLEAGGFPCAWEYATPREGFGTQSFFATSDWALEAMRTGPGSRCESSGSREELWSAMWRAPQEGSIDLGSLALK